MSEIKEIIKLRAHHICCSSLNLMAAADRGAKFAQQQQLIYDMLHSETANIQVAEGVDYLCAACLYRKGNLCEAPNGGDEGVRKWDAILIRELGISFGTVMSAPKWRTILAAKKPFQLCTRCNYRSICKTTIAKP